MTAIELTPEQEQQAQELAARIQTRSAEAVLAIARTLVCSTDATLFGDTEFAIRQKALGVVSVAYNEHLGEKKWLRRLIDRLPEVQRHGSWAIWEQLHPIQLMLIRLHTSFAHASPFS